MGSLGREPESVLKQQRVGIELCPQRAPERGSVENDPGGSVNSNQGASGGTRAPHSVRGSPGAPLLNVENLNAPNIISPLCRGETQVPVEWLSHTPEDLQPLSQPRLFRVCS